MKVQATEKFQELDTNYCFQRVGAIAYHALRRGEVVDLEKIPRHLMDGEYVEKVKTENKKRGL